MTHRIQESIIFMITDLLRRIQSKKSQMEEVHRAKIKGYSMESQGGQSFHTLSRRTTSQHSHTFPTRSSLSLLVLGYYGSFIPQAQLTDSLVLAAET
jgi:hypothetical protein